MPSNIPRKPLTDVAMILITRRAATAKGQAVQDAVLARIEAHIEASQAFRVQASQWIAELAA